jgi:fumarate hydratase class II
MCHNLRRFMIDGAQLNSSQIKQYVDRSVMMVTALAPVIGYDKASAIAHTAIDDDLTLKDAAIKCGVSEELFDRVVVPIELTKPGSADRP